ncbi:hypothetical protein PC9H_010331 [Pleurotus ostreatus]|uniref:RING-type domain-containing protein n=1 Tax=Pleurotus ostreatus TaxID=5322 RepID=A0A8H7DQ42_PLEOS|nr:uncharacterized protein PC9H_010331 [Pleurotus ostreatus]KAF7425020.1 hypothetical protein PC9H_010331 [Pleurotus ostreatus]
MSVPAGSGTIAPLTSPTGTGSPHGNKQWEDILEEMRCHLQDAERLAEEHHKMTNELLDLQMVGWLRKVQLPLIYAPQHHQTLQNRYQSDICIPKQDTAELQWMLEEQQKHSNTLRADLFTSRAALKESIRERDTDAARQQEERSRCTANATQLEKERLRFASTEREVYQSLICGICIDADGLLDTDGDDSMIVTRCGHIFCKTCLKGAENTVCPFCRSTKGTFPKAISVPGIRSALRAFKGHQTARRVERKTKLFNKRTARASQLTGSNFHRDMLDKLGLGGMSSDESDGGEEPVPTVCQVPWRSPHITKLLHELDDTGSPAERQHVVHAMPSSSKAVPCLPRNFYEAKWLSSLSKEKRRILAIQKSVDFTQTEDTLMDDDTM